MKALQKTAAAPGLALRDVDQPGTPSGAEVLIEVAAAGVCGSDLHIDEWTPGYEFMTSALPVTLGHEFSGRVVAVGPDAVDIAPGDRVTVVPYLTCGVCAECLAGGPQGCAAPRPGIGLRQDGGFARFVTVPMANCIHLPDSVSDEIAALTEPLTVGARAVVNGGVRNGDRVLVLGPGTIGQAIALMARRAGASEIVVAGRHDAARLAAVRRLGFERAVDIGDEPLDVAVRCAHGDAFDVVLEATGVPQVINPALRLARRGGVLVCAGIQPAPVAIDLTRLIREQQQIRGTHRAPRETWLDVVTALAVGGDAFAPMITHRLPLDRAIEAIEFARGREASKILLIPH